MRMTKAVTFAIQFATVSQELEIPLTDLGWMIEFAKASENAAVRFDGIKEQQWAKKVEEMAKVHGCTVSWPGLWPIIVRGNIRRHLPNLE